eukprot:3244240-Rhodomonas_salina.1
MIAERHSCPTLAVKRHSESHSQVSRLVSQTSIIVKSVVTGVIIECRNEPHCQASLLSLIVSH